MNFIAFYVRSNFKWNMFKGNGCFYVFSVDMLWEKCDSSFFYQLQQMLIVKHLLIWYKFRVFSLLLIVRADWKEMHSKIAVFIWKSPNFLTLEIKIGKNLKSILVHFTKEKIASRPTKVNWNEQKSHKYKHAKQKLNLKHSAETKKLKKTFFKERKWCWQTLNFLKIF